MKAFVCLSLLAVSSAAPAAQLLLNPHVGHHVAAGQTSHQSVSTAHGEVRTLSQSKAFGATHASVAQADNSKGLAEIQPAIAANKPVPVGKAAVVPHHAIAPVAHHAVHPVAHHAVHGVAHHAVHPVAHHAVHPVAHHAVHPVAHHAPVVHAAPAYAPAPVAYKPAPAPAYHKPAPAYHAEEYPDEISPYTFTYAVADDYSKSNFQRQEESDGASNVAGSYSVALPDGRIQHVKYTSNGYDGYVADVTYEGTAVYPEEPAYKPAPAYHA